MNASAERIDTSTNPAAATRGVSQPAEPPLESHSEHELSEPSEHLAAVEAIKAAIEESQLLVADYFDASSMAPLSSASVQALARLRAYTPPPFPIWSKIPTSARAAVLLLLYADRRGDLRVVITMRARSLRNFSGHAALPGGKADSLTETPFQIARREACEEIGLPRDDSKLPYPFRIEHLCELPHSLARTDVVVRPCVAFLHAGDAASAVKTNVEQGLMPRLDAREVAAVFTAPFHNFLKVEDELKEGDVVPGSPTDWYDGSWRRWRDVDWRVHNFHVPVTNQTVVKPPQREGGLDSIADIPEDEPEPARYLVWGTTARIILDAARVAYDEEAEVPHESYYGDEGIITQVFDQGGLEGKKRSAPALTSESSKVAKM